ncbi:exodeoxyribonuclease VII large subunit [Verticiella sediminum]|uniref:Exodeoxyribonuclease 7 large subunit n=1 Tax=Verticiella sediminum TaxID=1247510 RepID=A0A556AC15_9BURK|nr:exodeoxyribonuclease VII large subunit [Verticiella sediminum]TSH90436.1 exodeoxyribonuclease VII large subunit [Verticiella sediminum]
MNPGYSDTRVAPERPLSVSALNRAVAGVLEQGVGPVWVTGEVSNFMAAASGHWYFTLKDAGASVRAVMFRGKAVSVGFTPRAGDKVEVRARVTLYEPRGDYQLQVQAMRRAGQGDLFEAFLRLKAKLADEGLLDAARKRVPPAMPRAIGVVTSLHAAALRDVLSTLARRLPHVSVLVYPTPVQGMEAPPGIVAALERASRRGEVDVILLVRGGGSIEDLWGFNHEAVARAVAASPVPVICGVGHESDFTIADFVADVRAPTPTAAAELAGVPRDNLWQTVCAHACALQAAQERRLERLAQRLDRAAGRLVWPGQRLAHQRERLEAWTRRLRQVQAWRLAQWVQRVEHGRARLIPPTQRVERGRERLESLVRRLQRAQAWRHADLQQRLVATGQRLRVLGPQETLARGYAIARDDSGAVVRSASALRDGQRLSLDFAQGGADVTVEGTRG